MGNEGIKKHYLRDEPQWLVKPNNRLKRPLIVQLGFAEHPSTTTLGEELREQDHNVYVNAHPKKESDAFLKTELEQAQIKARELYARRIASGEVDAVLLETLLARIPLALFREARALILLMEEVMDVNEPAAVAGHSFGAQAAIVAAFLRPDLYPNQNKTQSTLVLLNPAGFTGKREAASPVVSASEKVRDTHINIKQKRFVETMEDLSRAGELQVRYFCSVVATALFRGAEGKKAFGDSVRYSVANLLNGRIDREARDMANTDIVPFANFLTEINGLRIVVVYDARDTTFPARIIEERQGEMPGVEFQKTSGKGHFGPVHDPKGTAGVIGKILKDR